MQLLKYFLPVLLIFIFFSVAKVNAVTILDTTSLTSSYSTRISFSTTVRKPIIVDTYGVQTIDGFSIQLAGNGATTVYANYYCNNDTLLATSTFSYNVASAMWTWNKTFSPALDVSSCDYFLISLDGSNTNSGITFINETYSLTNSDFYTKFPISKYAFAKSATTTPGNPETLYRHQTIDASFTGTIDGCSGSCVDPSTLICSDVNGCVATSTLVCSDVEGCMLSSSCNEYVPNPTCDTFYYSDDLTKYTSCSYSVDTLTGSTTETKYKISQVPLIAFIVLIIPLFYFVTRFVLEIIIRFRK